MENATSKIFTICLVHPPTKVKMVHARVIVVCDKLKDYMRLNSKKIGELFF
jgi:hypothetical protein